MNFMDIENKSLEELYEIAYWHETAWLDWAYESGKKENLDKKNMYMAYSKLNLIILWGLLDILKARGGYEGYKEIHDWNDFYEEIVEDEYKKTLSKI